MGGGAGTLGSSRKVSRVIEAAASQVWSAHTSKAFSHLPSGQGSSPTLGTCVAVMAACLADPLVQLAPMSLSWHGGGRLS